MTNLANHLSAAAAAHPERVALRLDDAVLDYTGLEAGTRRLAQVLRSRGVGPGDRVAVILPNIPQFPLVYFAVLRLGAVVVPLNPLLTGGEVAYHLADAGARLLVALPDAAPRLAEPVRAAGADLVTVAEALREAGGVGDPGGDPVSRADDDLAVLLYTSGTTGRPKGASLTHGNLASNARAMPALSDLESRDVIFGGLPFFHVFGQTAVLNGAVFEGAEVTLLPRFDADKALEIIERDRVTIIEGVPTMYIAMLRSERIGRTDFSSVRVGITGGAAMPVEVLAEFERVTGVPVIEGYGLSETSPICAFNHLGRPRKAGTVGQAIDGVELRIVGPDGAPLTAGEVGELTVRGPNVMTGYWNRPEDTAEAMSGDWFRTGDLARMDEEGYVSIVDRTKDVIIRGGYNVYPREIEEVLYGHPAIAEAAVVGRPDALLGEEVTATVTLRPGAAATPEEIRGWIKERVAAYKYPREVTVIDALPKGPTGKILKRRLRAAADPVG